MKDTEKENPAYTKAGGVDAPAEETRKSVRATACFLPSIRTMAFPFNITTK
ncbi:hypothetical protein NXX78_19555 [Bacteroides fragilis]|nr:hypothetical protein [Bacteroides fragilis]